MEPFRGWKAAPTTKMTRTIFKLKSGQKSGKSKIYASFSTNQFIYGICK